ncbi:ABC transporter ATP-binding protein [Dyella subtropica]|uniref:ABC transporter ATP-binding protein n=1 Tax=Dyella subtropica TaxID=2992127 RepID=UPI00224E4ECA|nr:ABC transporter ATP-binding protein [Dyella subtropica]
MARHDPGREEAAAPSEDEPAQPAAPGVLDDIGRAGRAFKGLFGAQLTLLGAELGLARSAISWMLLAGLAATVAGVGLGLTLMALAGVLLAAWFHSWIWALVLLVVLQAALLFATIVLFRRCMYWLSLPASRYEWLETIRQALRKAERNEAGVSEAERAGATREDGT